MQKTETVVITVNGETKEAPIPINVVQLLESLGLRAGRVAIERNLQILPRSEWPTTQIAAGDRYEIVSFVGGG